MSQGGKGRRDDDRRPCRTATSPAAAATVRVAGAALAAAAPALLLVVVLLAPFLGKAFTIDDTVFLRQAEWVLHDPLHPSSLTMVWSEVPRPMRLSQVMPTGPLMAWLLVPVALAGGSEVVAHLVQLLLLLVAVFAVAVLALRLGCDEATARLSALLLASTPAVLGMAGTVMPDVAAMTLGVVGVERLIAWGGEGRGGGKGQVGAGLAAALALGLAPLARSHLILLPGLALFVLPLPWKPMAWRRWWPVLLAPVLTLALVELTRDPLGTSSDMARSAGLFSSAGNVRANLIAFGTHWMLLLPLGLAWALGRAGRFWRSPLPWLGMAAAAAALLYGGQRDWMAIAPVAGLGIAVVIDVVRVAVVRVLGDRDWSAMSRASHLLLPAWLLIAVPVVVYLHFPSKYLLACAPAGAIVAAAVVCALPIRFAAVLGGTLVTAGALLGTLILQADSNFSGLGRRAVDELIVPRVAAGERVWFNANWGFQWYAERAGATILTSNGPRPEPGDLVVTARTTIANISIETFPRRELLATVSDSSPGGRILSSELGAGFYSNGWGYLPWAWGATELDRFELWRIR